MVANRVSGERGCLPRRGIIRIAQGIEGGRVRVR